MKTIKLALVAFSIAFCINTSCFGQNADVIPSGFDELDQ